jgi:DNA-binding GntR family transcriptional regulator
VPGEEGYLRLREAIVDGRLLPTQRLVEADLSEELGVGRAAIRTALARLDQEGLIEHVRNRGARVRLVEQDEAVEILEARAALESLAARLAAVARDEEDVTALGEILAEMRRLLADGDLLAASDRNALLHRRIVAASGHATVARLISGLNSQLVRFQYRTIMLPGRRDRSYEEHEEIVEAIVAGDADRAETAMRRHLSHVAEALRGAAAEEKR